MSQKSESFTGSVNWYEDVMCAIEAAEAEAATGRGMKMGTLDNRYVAGSSPLQSIWGHWANGTFLLMSDGAWEACGAHAAAQG
jgi:hypothetical protein